VLYRWFVGLSLDDPIWSPTTFSKNRNRLLASEVAGAFFDGVLAPARKAGLLSEEHFTVDGTLLGASRLAPNCQRGVRLFRHLYTLGAVLLSRASWTLIGPLPDLRPA
jgi:hypothetical protein